MPTYLPLHTSYPRRYKPHHISSPPGINDNHPTTFIMSPVRYEALPQPPNITCHRFQGRLIKAFTIPPQRVPFVGTADVNCGSSGQLQISNKDTGAIFGCVKCIVIRDSWWVILVEGWRLRGIFDDVLSRPGIYWEVVYLKTIRNY